MSSVERLRADPAQPPPDPGNSPPEDWTAPLSDEEMREIADLLRREDGES